MTEEEVHELCKLFTTADDRCWTCGFALAKQAQRMWPQFDWYGIWNEEWSKA